MTKDKPNPPQKPKSDFIKFSKLQQTYLIEVRSRQVEEFNKAVNIVFEELGIVDEIRKTPSKIYKLKMDDLSGVDILPREPEK